MNSELCSPQNFFLSLAPFLFQRSVGVVFLVCLLSLGACREPERSLEDVVARDKTPEPETANVEPKTYELSAKQFWDSRLTKEQLEAGWVRLFDEQSLYGWLMAGKANWSVNDGVLQVSQGEQSLLCTNFQLANYELKLEFRCDADTNSGIFLRTAPSPTDVATKCLELNIAPTDNPFPTGSFVQREKLEPRELDAKLGTVFDSSKWHTYRVKLLRNRVEVYLDEVQVMELEDFESDPSGYIGLQHNSGKVEFRNVLLRPLSIQALMLDENWSKDWRKFGSALDVFVEENGLRLKGGLGQLQSNYDFDDFFLQASYSLKKPDVNSGIFFRCIRDNMLDGYECQVNHAIGGKDPFQPLDAGAGAIFRQVDARVVIGDGTDHSHISLAPPWCLLMKPWGC
ncbi:MAG: family 16 glycoside hydrolase [Planctomycetota bacterium]